MYLVPDANLVGPDLRDVVDVQDKVKHDERALPHDDADVAAVDDLAIVNLLEGVRVLPGRTLGGNSIDLSIFGLLFRPIFGSLFGLLLLD